MRERREEGEDKREATGRGAINLHFPAPVTDLRDKDIRKQTLMNVEPSRG